jgi:hypothetical protein
MTFRFNTTCERCGKKDSVFGRNKFCDDCLLRGHFKSLIKLNLRERELNKELREMKPEIKAKIHDELLKEILEEQKKNEKRN